MSLEPGTSLGPYEVVTKIGEGGMGEVYRARDTKLDRDVALKVLPQAFTDDPDRLARFEREAKVLASLNHPNIGHIYGLEEAEGQKALVLELVEGPTLAERIKQGPIPVDEALPIAKQIAEALEAAHEQGVIHRDLKPANIKLKPDGTVKVLDFGLAKAFQPDASDVSASMSPTISLTAAATQMGMVIGTAAYMAPEQARGKQVDRRADIFAFGVVLYEMLTGQRPFQGEDVSLTLAAVMTFDPDLDLLPEALSPTLKTYLTRCLAKDPKERRGGPHPLDRVSSQLRWNPVHDSSGFVCWLSSSPSVSVRLLRRPVIERRVGPAPVVEVHPPTDAGPNLGTGCELGQVDAFVRERSPQPLDEHVVHPAALAVHRDADASLLEHVGEVDAGELAALVAIKDLRRAIALERLVQGVHAEARIERVGQAPGQDLAARPVHHRDEVQKASLQWDIGNIRAPHVVRSRDLQIA